LIKSLGVSIECGILEDPSKEPPKDAYQITKSPKDAPSKEAYITVGFNKGVPVSLNKKKYTGVELIEKLNKTKSNQPPIIVYTGKDLTKKENETLEKYAESIIIKGVKYGRKIIRRNCAIYAQSNC